MKKYILFAVFFMMFTASATYATGGNMGNHDGYVPDGTAANPWLIEDLADFQAFCDTTSYWATGVHTKLTTNLDLSTMGTYTESPIAGDNKDNNSFDGTQYKGDFNGNGHIICNFAVNSGEYCGMFGFVGDGGSISNLVLNSISVVGSWNYVGGLVGWNASGSISNCRVTGSVTCATRANSIGGLVGRNSSGRISNCYTTVSVSGSSDYVGGLVGWNLSGSIINCYTAGSLTNSRFVGGLVGRNDSGSISSCCAIGVASGYITVGGLLGSNTSGSISNCYATGSVTGSEGVGGLIGGNGGNISNCYSTGPVVGYRSTFGGLIGSCSGGISNCYFYKYRGVNNGYGSDLDDEQLQDKNNFVGFDFVGDSSDGTEDVWVIEPGYMPRLAGQDSPGFKAPYSLDNIETTLSGSGHPEDPFLISSYEDMLELRNNSSLRIGCYSLTEDIDLSGNTYSNAFISGIFMGSFSGNGHKISNLTIKHEKIDRIGLFAALSGQISNLSLENVCFSGNAYESYYCLGGLVGYDYYGSISNCYVTGSISGNYFDVGGLVGTNDSGRISKCYTTVSITVYSYSVGGLVGSSSGSINNSYATGPVCSDADFNVGGLVGVNSGSISNCCATGLVYSNHASSVGGLVGRDFRSSIINSYATGSVSGYTAVGGLVGSVSGSISNCYATGSVTGSHDVGGLAGSAGGNISNCYATGFVSCFGYKGGLIGYCHFSGTITSCFWDIQTTGQTTGCYLLPGSIYKIINVQGLSTDLMQIQDTFTDQDWDFSPVNIDGDVADWQIRSGSYPRLNWQVVAGDIAGGWGVDMADMEALAGDWLGSGIGDINADGQTDMLDFAAMAKNWLVMN